MSHAVPKSAVPRLSRAFAAPISAPVCAGLCALGLALLAPGGHAQGKPAHVAVATENAVATREAMAQLDAGGNAVDAIVSAVLVSGVTAPSSSGLGGGGFAMLWRAATREPYVLDFRETAPAAIDPATFETRPFKAAERGRATGVPGELAGLFELQHSFGKRKWRDVVLPAARVARSGFPVSPHLATVLSGLAPKTPAGFQDGAYKDAYADQVVATDPGIASVFFPGKKAANDGQRVTNPKLARTLETIAAQGKTALYEGALGRDLVASVRQKGGALSESDLKAYRPLPRAPLHVRWEGYDVYTMPPPSAGGLMLAETLGTFSKAELQRLALNSGAYQHTLAEAMRGALADRLRYLGDPDFEKLDLPALLDPKRLAARKQLISSERTHALPRFASDEHGTHHLLVVDAEGNVASITTTVNTAFGAKFSGAQSGIVANDELTDFNRQKDVLPFGLQQSPNRPRAGARPVSSMTPTLVVKDGKVVLALGGSGGPLIATNVTQLLLAHLAFGLSPEALVHLPRFAVPTAGPSLLLESGTAPALQDDLAWRGEVSVVMPSNLSAVQVVAIATDGSVSAASDPRKHGSALAK
jgi:gamma-glutamyltranspeptidase/glutathione hydrolase